MLRRFGAPQGERKPASGSGTAKGNRMDTIELLEAVGSDAHWRRATRAALLDALRQAGATPALVAAVARDERAPLAAEFGSVAYCVVESTHSPGHEGEDEGEDDDDEPEEPAGGDDRGS